MHKLLINQEKILSETKKIIKRVWKVQKSDNYPGGLEFSFQYLKFIENTWIQIARIDNQLHKGKPGTHIHKNKYVKWENLGFQESEKRIEEIAKNEN